MSAWKSFERSAASLFSGFRYWANSGERLDFKGYIQSQLHPTHQIHGQCKLVKTLSLEALSKLAEEKDVDVVVVKRRRGKGKPSPTLVVFTEENYRRLHSGTTSTATTEAPCVPLSPLPTLPLDGSTSPSPSGQSQFSAPLRQKYSREKPTLLHGQF